MTTTVTPLAGDFPAADAERWRGLVDKILKGADYEKRLVAKTADGLKIEPVYVRSSLEGVPAGGVPGTAPYLRGARPNSMGGWDIRAVHAEGDAAAANAAILDDLQCGATSVLLQIASDGRSGLQPNAEVVARALQGVMLDVCPVALDAGSQGMVAARALMQAWETRGIKTDSRLGALNADPIGVLAETGALALEADDALIDAAKLVADVQGVPHVTALRANGHVWHRGGASEAQELAATLATLVQYLRAVETAGIGADAALPKIAITLAIDADQLMGLAKLRAARALVARVADACGAATAVERMSFTAESSLRMMSKRDPWVNMLRTTMACAVGAMANADAMTVYPFSWALGQPDAFARRIARNTSIVLMEESGLARVADPAGGSFAIEKLTDDLAREAWRFFQEIEAEGGIIASLAAGKIQGRIAATQTQRLKALATGRQEMTGTSAFPMLGGDGVTVTAWPKSESKSVAGGARVTALNTARLSEPFEALREKADAFEAKSGAKPKVFLACLGPLAVHGARATWIKNYLAAGGIEGVGSGEITQSQDAGQAFAASGATVACICSSDAVYGELGEAVASLLKTAGATRVYLAGRPKDQEAALKAAGVDSFIFAGSDMLETLKGRAGGAWGLTVTRARLATRSTGGTAAGPPVFFSLLPDRPLRRSQVSEVGLRKNPRLLECCTFGVEQSDLGLRAVGHGRNDFAVEVWFAKHARGTGCCDLFADVGQSFSTRRSVGVGSDRTRRVKPEAPLEILQGIVEHDVRLLIQPLQRCRELGCERVEVLLGRLGVGFVNGGVCRRFGREARGDVIKHGFGIVGIEPSVAVYRGTLLLAAMVVVMPFGFGGMLMLFEGAARAGLQGRHACGLDE